jgi:hypothetical protein
LEEILVDGDVLDSHNALLWFHFFNGVHQKEGVAVWQDLLDAYTVEDHRLLASACYELRVAHLVRRYRARIVNALRWEFESRRAFTISSRSARMTSTPPHPMVVATDENFHRRTIKQFYTKPAQVGIAVASSSRPRRMNETAHATKPGPLLGWPRVRNGRIKE